MADGSDTPRIEHMTELPPAERLAKLRAVETWLEWQLRQTRQRIHALEQEQAKPVEYKLEERLREGHPLGAAIHVADCAMTQRETRPIDAGVARDALTKDRKFFRACEFCTPEKTLGLEG
jgi:hypothetical protein